ncbi:MULTISPECIES: chorismate mutase [unclassified Streptomyces]|uniref:chorismate mutase n=1 Tax=unclassified Streptomyces TaxID=2593676 RepID=UPI003D73FAE4
MSPIDSARITERKQQLHAIDQDIIDLIRQRQDTVWQLRTLRRMAGLREYQLALENEVLSHYHEALGRTGTSIALQLLSLARSEAAGEHAASSAA